MQCEAEHLQQRGRGCQGEWNGPSGAAEYRVCARKGGREGGGQTDTPTQRARTDARTNGLAHTEREKAAVA